MSKYVLYKDVSLLALRSLGLVNSEWAMLVQGLQTIEIVHCKECKHWDDRRGDDWWSEDGACYKDSILGHAIYRKADDYCSYGERKESE